MAFTENIEISAGDSIELLFDISSELLTTFGQVEDIEWLMAWTKYARTEEVNILKRVHEGIEITDTNGLECMVTLNPNDTKDLSGKYYHELRLVLPDGGMTTVTVGTINIIRTIPNEVT